MLLVMNLVFIIVAPSSYRISNLQSGRVVAFKIIFYILEAMFISFIISHHFAYKKLLARYEANPDERQNMPFIYNMPRID